MVAHGGQLPRAIEGRVGGLEGRFDRPDTDISVYIDKHHRREILFDDKPPAAVTNLEPSGETWQL